MDDIERLKREIRQLRMELGNREANFNRVFTTHQPIYLSHAVKQRTDLTPQITSHRNDVTVTSRYCSATSGRSETQLSSAQNRLTTGKQNYHDRLILYLYFIYY